MSAEPLNGTPEDSEARPRKTLGPTNPDETYARYERSPFRNYSLKPSQENQDGPTRQSSLMDRINSVRFKFSNEGRRGKGGSGKKKDDGSRPRPDYSLAGPKANEDDEYDSYDSDEGYGDYGRRPQVTIGLAKPFPRGKRGSRWRKSHTKDKKKEKRANAGSRTEPGSESGKPEGQVGVSKAMNLTVY